MLLSNQSAFLSAEQQLLFAYQLNALGQENDQLKEKVSTLEVENSVLLNEILRLKEQLGLSKQARFGKKSEVGETVPGMDKPVSVSAHTRKQKTKGRLADLSLLPRHKIYHDLSAEEKTCACCHKPLLRIGQDVCEQIEVLPQRLYVAEHIRYKYAGCDCQTVYMSPKEKAPIPKALAGGSLLTEIIINKYHYHLPLYRQSKILASYQAIIPDNTLGNWVMQVGSALLPVYASLWQAVLSAGYLQVDETPVKMLNSEKKAYLWSYYAPHSGKGLVAFECSLTRSGDVAQERLAAYEGLLQTDGYSGYNKLRQRDNIEGLGCLTHARRRFDEVIKISNNKQGLAAQAIERLKPLYALESHLRAQHYPFRVKKHFRQKIARPALQDFIRWLKQVAPQVPRKSKLGEAIDYTLRQWPYLIKYLRHGMAEIDTNWVENKIREIALGRKNWLFMGNKDSAQIHAVFYSLLLSSLANDLNPRIYMHYLIMQIHDIRQGKVDPQTLLPHVIDRNLLQAFTDKQLQQAKEVLRQLE